MERLFFSGNARLPRGLPAHELYETLSLSIECESRWGVILDADCTLATDLGTRFVRELFVGHSVLHDMRELDRLIGARYQGAAQRALLAALRDLEQQCNQFWKSEESERRGQPGTVVTTQSEPGPRDTEPDRQ